MPNAANHMHYRIKVIAAVSLAASLGTHPSRRRRLFRAALPVLLAWCTGCGDEATIIDAPADPGAPSSSVSSADPAYIVAIRVDAVEGRFIYMGAFSQIPTSEPSRDRMAELAGRWQVTAYGGRAFAWEQETGQMTSWSIAGDLSLRRGATMSLGQLGLDGWRVHAFVSPTRAYTLGLELGVVAVWNPETMEIVDELRFEAPPDFADMDAYPLSVFIRDGKIVAPLYGDNLEAQRVAKRQVVGVIDTATDAVNFLYDERCLPSGLGHMTAAGDLYLDPYQSGTFYDAYGLEPGLPPPCGLRILAGQERIDPDYVLDYSSLLGVHAEGVWPIAENLVMTLSRAPEVPLPESQDDYWSMPQQSSSVDLVTRAVQPYTGMPAALQMQSATQHVVDGRSFYQNYRYLADGPIDVVEVGELTPRGWVKQFDINGGDLWALLRAR
jgi:hypothetical protein